MLTTALLTIGILLAPFGTFTYVAAAMTDPDPETLHIARTIARTGRYTAIAGLAIHFIHSLVTHAAVGPVMDLAVAVACAAVVATTYAELRVPQTPRHV